MEAIFTALQARFKADTEAKKVLGRLYQGFEGEPIRSVLPYVEVSKSNESDELDTFDSDVESFDLTFTIFTKRLHPKKPNQGTSILRRLFDDVDLASESFNTVMFRRTGGDGPKLVDSLYQASITFSVILHRKTPVPTR